MLNTRQLTIATAGFCASALVLAVFIDASNAASGTGPVLTRAEIAERLAASYPESIRTAYPNRVIFRDGSELPLDDGKEHKDFDTWLKKPDIEDMFRYPYDGTAAAMPPARDFDPGRARNEAFFLKLYGDCRKPHFSSTLTEINWLPRKSSQRLAVTRLNGVALRLQAISRELDDLPAEFDRYLVPAAGSFNCRVVAGTNQRSAHAFAIAIDIAVKHAHYWRWSTIRPADIIAYRNEIPMEIVRIFEKHGFIWGGRWHHYDTMHFEYRPELLPAPVPLPSP